jgi:DNA-binding XRE family transcriptional regulator
MSAFGQLLRAAREEHGLSEWELSQVLGVTPQTIFEWETGKAKPKVLEVVVLRDLLGEQTYSALARSLAES